MNIQIFQIIVTVIATAATPFIANWLQNRTEHRRDRRQKIEEISVLFDIYWSDLSKQYAPFTYNTAANILRIYSDDSPSYIPSKLPEYDSPEFMEIKRLMDIGLPVARNALLDLKATELKLRDIIDRWFFSESYSGDSVGADLHKAEVDIGNLFNQLFSKAEIIYIHINETLHLINTPELIVNVPWKKLFRMPIIIGIDLALLIILGVISQ